MSTESDRLIAERMGITPCKLAPNLYAHRPGVTCEEDACRKPFLYWPDLADANTREAVLDYLTSKGFRVLIACTEFECTVKIMRSNGAGQWVYFPEATAHLDADGPDYKAVAFRAAVLAATEAQDG